MIPRSQEVQRLVWAASQMVSRELPYTVLKGLWLRLVLTTTNVAGVALTALRLASAIQDIRVKINGSDTRVAITGEQLFILNSYDFSAAPVSVVSNVVAVGQTQMLNLYLPFALTRAVRPADSVLDLRKSQGNPVSTAYIEVTFGAAVGMDANATITAGRIEIETDEYDASMLPANVRPFQAIHEFSYHTQALSALGRNRVSLEVGGINEYRRLFLLTKNAAGAFSDAEIDMVRLVSRGYTWRDWANAAFLQANNALRYSLAASLTGVHILDMTTDGLMSERLDAKGLDELILEPNAILATGTIQILKEKIYYIPQGT